MEGRVSLSVVMMDAGSGRGGSEQMVVHRVMFHRMMVAREALHCSCR